MLRMLPLVKESNLFFYFLRRIEYLKDYVDLFDEVIHASFLPTIFGRAEPLPKDLKVLVFLG